MAVSKGVITSSNVKVNGLLDQNTHGYSINEDNNAIPLKRFIHCDDCGKPMRGYLVHKKKIHYYKCNTIGCGNNKSAATLNQRFATILEAFRLDVASDLLQLIKNQTVATFNQLTKGHEGEYAVLQKQHEELTEKVNRLEERFIDEEINSELYNNYSEKFSIEKKEIEKDLSKASKQVSNLEECVEVAISFASKLPSNWLSADYFTKHQIQFLVFPEGIMYNKKNDICRTNRINTVFAHIAH
jgi:site-specific DNA recombinase